MPQFPTTKKHCTIQALRLPSTTFESSPYSCCCSAHATRTNISDEIVLRWPITIITMVLINHPVQAKVMGMFKTPTPIQQEGGGGMLSETWEETKVSIDKLQQNDGGCSGNKKFDSNFAHQYRRSSGVIVIVVQWHPNE